MRIIVFVILSIATQIPALAQKITPVTASSSLQAKEQSQTIETTFLKIEKSLNVSYEMLSMEIRNSIAQNNSQLESNAKLVKDLQKKVDVQVNTAYKLQRSKSNAGEYNRALIELASTIDQVKVVLLKSAVNKRQIKQLDNQKQVIDKEVVLIRTDIQKQKIRTTELLKQIPAKEIPFALQTIESDQSTILKEKFLALRAKIQGDLLAVSPAPR